MSVGIISAADDPVFPEPKMRKLLQNHDIAQFHTITGGHNGLNANPRVVMTEAIEMLERMNIRREFGAENVDLVGDNVLLK